MLVAEANRFHFAGNSAVYQGSAIYSQDGSELRITSANFSSNTVAVTEICGGAVSLLRQKEAISFQNVTFTDNAYSALCIAESSATFSGTTVFRNTEGIIGGGIYTRKSCMSFTGYTVFDKNRAHFGGAICGVDSKASFSGVLLVSTNVAIKGGAFYALQTDISFDNTAYLSFNEAEQGGALYLNSASTVTLEPHTTLTTSHNRASKYGGSIFYADTPTQDQCDSKGRAYFTPNCFIQLKDMTTTRTPFSINSYNDSAGIDGSFLYGGLLDRCKINIFVNNTYEIFENKV